MPRTTRRPKGDGSIWRSTDKRTWFAELIIGYDENGKPRRRRVQAPSQGAVLKKLTTMRGAVSVGALAHGGHLSARDYLSKWLDSTKASLRASTHARYEGILRQHVTQRIGALPLDKITPLHVQDVYSHALKSGLSSTTVRQVHAVLRRAMGQALRQGLVNRNPCDAVDAPTKARHEMRTLTALEVKRLEIAAMLTVKQRDEVDAIPDQKRRIAALERLGRVDHAGEPADGLAALYVLAVRTGMRQGELLGLQWDDIDFRGRALHVRRSLSEVSGKHDLVDTKTGKARRVDIDAKCVRVLKEQRARRAREVMHARSRAAREGTSTEAATRALESAERMQRSPLIFVDSEGHPVRKSNMLRRSFAPLLERAVVPVVRFHDLRHTHATLALQGDVHPKIVQERLGHANIGQTLDTYSHSVPSMQRDAADIVASLLN